MFDTRNIEEVIDQARELSGLAACDVERGFAPRLVKIRGRDRICHRGKWIAQLMSQHREEFILAFIGFREVVDFFAQLLFDGAAHRHLRFEQFGFLLQVDDDAHPRVRSA